jgi:hypothetical protein
MAAVFACWACEESNMNRDDIIRMAHEAGFSDVVKKGVWVTDGFWDEELERFAELVAAAERESCAKVCEGEVVGPIEPDWNMACEECAAAIRARGDL